MQSQGIYIIWCISNGRIIPCYKYTQVCRAVLSNNLRLRNLGFGNIKGHLANFNQRGRWMASPSNFKTEGVPNLGLSAISAAEQKVYCQESTFGWQDLGMSVV
jgi:hypothetical protein